MPYKLKLFDSKSNPLTLCISSVNMFATGSEEVGSILEIIASPCLI